MAKFGDGDSKDVINIERGHKSGGLIPEESGPYKKRHQRAHRFALSVRTSSKEHMSAQREGSHL